MRRGLLAITIVTLAAAVRWFGLTDARLWFDEIWHAEIATGRGSAHLRLPLDQVISAAPDTTSLRSAPPIWTIPRNVDWVLHPPLFHVVQRGWRAVFGDSDWSIRSMSAFFSTLAAAATMGLVWRRGGWFARLLTGAVLAFSATQVNQAQDARGYPLLLLETIAAVAVALKLRDGDRPLLWAGILSLLFAAMMWTHYFAAGACLGLFLFVLIGSSNRVRLAVASCTLLVGVIWLALWWPTLRQQLSVVEESADIFLLDQGPGQTVRALLGAVSTPLRLIWSRDDLPPWLLAAAAVPIWIVLVRRSRKDSLAAAWFWVLATTVLSLLVLDLLRGTQHHAYVRYAFAASAAPAVAIAVSISSLKQRRAATWAVLFLFAVSLPFGIQRNQIDARFVMGFVREQLQPGDAIVLVSPDAAGFEGRTLYLYTAWYARPFPRTLLITTKPIDAEMSRKLPRSAIIIAANPTTSSDLVWPGSRSTSAVRSATWGSAVRVVAPPIDSP